MEKLQQWLDMTKKYQKDSYWSDIFKTNVNENYRETVNDYTSNFFKQQDIFPRCDMYIQENHLVIEAELPGLNRNEVKVVLLLDEIVIKGDLNTLKANLKYFIKERANRTFEKKLTLPVSVKKGEINTYFQNGVLTIVLPVKIEQDEAVPISILD